MEAIIFYELQSFFLNEKKTINRRSGKVRLHHLMNRTPFTDIYKQWTYLRTHLFLIRSKRRRL